MSRHDKLTVRQSSLMKCQLQLQEADFSFYLEFNYQKLAGYELGISTSPNNVLLPLYVPYREVESNQIGVWEGGQVIKSH